MMGDDENKNPLNGSGGGPTDMVPMDQALAVVEARNKVMERVRTVAIQSTKGHWLDHDGKPRLDSYGAEIVARTFGIRIVDKAWERVDHPDDGAGAHYEYVVTGTFCLPGGIDRLENVIGTASSRDKFLGTETKQGRDISEVQPGVILKKAESNMMQRGVTMLCGLRGMNWEQLAKYGVTSADAPKVEYKHGAQGGSVDRKWTFKFGSAKGKTPEEASDKELAFYIGRTEEELGQPEKAKFKASNEATLKVLRAEVERRKTAAPANGKGGNPTWVKVKEIAVDYEIGDEQIGPLVRKATGKTKIGELVDGDLDPIEAAFAEASRGRVADESLPGIN